MTGLPHSFSFSFSFSIATLAKSLLLSLALGAASGCVLLPALSGPPPALDPPPARDRPPAREWKDLRGIFHCHSYLSHDSQGSIEEIAAAARGAGALFVAMTDHFTPQGVDQGPRGFVDGTLFLVGAEISSEAGSVLAIGLGAKRVRDFHGSSGDLFAEIQAAGGLAFIGHAEEFRGWDHPGFDGLEVYNLHADALDDRFTTFLFSGIFETPPGFFTRLIDRPAEVLARWDSLGLERRVPGAGGCDAHANVRLFGPLGGTIGTYAECFRVVTTHVLARDLSEASVMEALREGRAYVAFEIRGDATGFSFDLVDGRAPPGERAVAGMGEEVPFREGLRLSVRAPGGERARLSLLRDGRPALEAPGGLLEAPLAGPGVYRAEVTLDGKPFIFSNPIYVRKARPLTGPMRPAPGRAPKGAPARSAAGPDRRSSSGR